MGDGFQPRRARRNPSKDPSFRRIMRADACRDVSQAGCVIQNGF
jgi:hypothetical protein